MGWQIRITPSVFIVSFLIIRAQMSLGDWMRMWQSQEKIRENFNRNEVLFNQRNITDGENEKTKQKKKTVAWHCRQDKIIPCSVAKVEGDAKGWSTTLSTETRISPLVSSWWGQYIPGTFALSLSLSIYIYIYIYFNLARWSHNQLRHSQQF